MLNPYFLMSILYVSLAALAALDASLASWSLVQWFDGLRWLRVHLITLGTLTEVIFGLLPTLTAIRLNQPKPKTRWDTWLTLNGGLVTLLIGIPLKNGALMLSGGTLIFIATSLLMKRLADLREQAPSSKPTAAGPHTGWKFYLTGLGFLLLGIIVGTGLWIGWPAILRIRVPIEVHIHANNWGFMSLVFAGVIVDLYPTFAKRSLAWPRSITPIFWMMSIGAALLVTGPWLKNEIFSSATRSSRICLPASSFRTRKPNSAATGSV